MVDKKGVLIQAGDIVISSLSNCKRDYEVIWVLDNKICLRPIHPLCKTESDLVTGENRKLTVSCYSILHRRAVKEKLTTSDVAKYNTGTENACIETACRQLQLKCIPVIAESEECTQYMVSKKWGRAAITVNIHNTEWFLEQKKRAIQAARTVEAFTDVFIYLLRRSLTERFVMKKGK